MRRAFLFVLTGVLICAAPAADMGFAEPNRAVTDATFGVEEELRQKLAAERDLNERLRRRVAELERLLRETGAEDAPSLVAWDAEPEMERIPDTPEGRSAIEEALLSRGLVLLPSGTYRFTPSVSWSHDGSGNDRRESYFFAAQLEAGLPKGFAAGVRIPYVKRDYAIGSAHGVGDITVGLRRKLNNETESMPSLVARLDYTHDTGSHPFRPVPISSGFRSFDLGLSAVKRIDPLAVSGSISYDRALIQRGVSIERDGVELFRGDIKRGDALTLGLGVSLAVTPDISLDAGVSMLFQKGTRFSFYDGSSLQSSRTKAGYINLGTGMILSRNLYLLLSVAAGITDDATDSIFSLLLPYRF